MKTIILLCLFSLGLTAQIDDKTKHVYAGMGIAIVTAEITNQIIERPAISAATGFVLGSLAGIAKEAVYDKRMDKGTCSNLDAGMTMWGAAIGSMVIRVKFDLCDKKKQKQLDKLKRIE